MGVRLIIIRPLLGELGMELPEPIQAGRERSGVPVNRPTAGVDQDGDLAPLAGNLPGGRVKGAGGYACTSSGRPGAPYRGCPRGCPVSGSRRSSGAPGQVWCRCQSQRGFSPRRTPIYWFAMHLVRGRMAQPGPAVPDPGAHDPDPMRTTKRSSGYQIAHIGMGMSIDIHRDE